MLIEAQTSFSTLFNLKEHLFAYRSTLHKVCWSLIAIIKFDMLWLFTKQFFLSPKFPDTSWYVIPGSVGEEKKLACEESAYYAF